MKKIIKRISCCLIIAFLIHIKNAHSEMLLTDTLKITTTTLQKKNILVLEVNYYFAPGSYYYRKLSNKVALGVGGNVGFIVFHQFVHYSSGKGKFSAGSLSVASVEVRLITNIYSGHHFRIQLCNGFHYSPLVNLLDMGPVSDFKAIMIMPMLTWKFIYLGSALLGGINNYYALPNEFAIWSIILRLGFTLNSRP